MVLVFGSLGDQFNPSLLITLISDSEWIDVAFSSADCLPLISRSARRLSVYHGQSSNTPTGLDVSADSV